MSAKDLQGFQIKPFALVESMFEEVMLVDADVLFFQQPEKLWNNASYQATGTMVRDNSVLDAHNLHQNADTVHDLQSSNDTFIMFTQL